MRRTLTFLIALGLAVALGALPLGVAPAAAEQHLNNKLYITADAANVRTAPSTSAPVVLRVPRGDYVLVNKPVEGEEVNGNKTWYRTKSGWYISESVTVNVPSDKTYRFDGPRAQRRIEVDISDGMARAFQGNQVVHEAKVVTGRPGFETPLGEFRIQWRAETRTMDSATVGVPHDRNDAYVIPNVRYAQYFTNKGEALHGNYWVEPRLFGSGQTSRGCVGLSNEDAKVFWDFASVGTRVIIRY